MTTLILTSILLFALTCVLTNGFRRYALKKGVIDIPNARSSHSIPTPRGGGISIVVGYLALLSFLWFQQKIAFEVAASIFIGGGLVALIGFWDDHRHINPKWRFLAHVTAALASLLLIGQFPQISLGNLSIDMGWLALPFLTVSLVWLLNLFNFMDGIDGIAGVEAISIAGGAAVILFLNGVDDFSWMLFSLVCCVSGFLVWNWPPARIFMGDACSGFLGFLLGLLAIISSASYPESINLWSWVILFGVFIVDATWTLIRRIIGGKKWYEAHRSHAYQILSRRYGSHKKITVGVLLINVLWLLPIAFIASRNESWSLLLCVCALLPLAFLTYLVKAGTTNE